MDIMMADDSLEDASLDEETPNVTSKKFSKSMLTKRAIGLLVLWLIAGAAYFFFMPADDSSSEETMTKLNDATTSPESVKNEAESADNTLDNESSAEQAELLKLREETSALKAENLKIKEQLSKLEEVQSPNTETTKPEMASTTNAAEESDKKTTTISTQPKTKQNQYSNLYIKEKAAARESQPKTIKPQPVQRQRDLTPPPAPKWGDFAPTYNGK
jgi:myosin heavy subunit